MSLALAEQSIQLLTCQISRWRLCHRLPQDNQSKSWKKVWPRFHWSFLMPLAPAGQSIQLLICHISRRRLCHHSPQDNQSNLGKRCDLWYCCHWGWCLWNLGTVYCWCTEGWEYLLKFKKELKSFLSVWPSAALAGFFPSKYSVLCLQTETGCCPWRLSLAPVEQSIQLFICHTSRLRLCYH